MDAELLAFSVMVANELRASSPYKTGNMQRSINTIVIDEDCIDIVVAVDYASYVNDKGIHQNWVEKVVERCVRSYFSNNVDDSSLKTGVRYDVLKNL